MFDKMIKKAEKDIVKKSLQSVYSSNTLEGNDYLRIHDNGKSIYKIVICRKSGNIKAIKDFKTDTYFTSL